MLFIQHNNATQISHHKNYLIILLLHTMKFLTYLGVLHLKKEKSIHFLEKFLEERTKFATKLVRQIFKSSSFR